MIVIIIGLYVGIIWLLFFKLEIVEPNAKSYTAAAIIGVVIIGAILLAANLFQPYSKSAVVSQYVVQVAPRVFGLVTKIDVQPNVPVKKGDVLFEIDPRPFQVCRGWIAGSARPGRAEREDAKGELRHGPGERNQHPSRAGQLPPAGQEVRSEPGCRDGKRVSGGSEA